MLMMLMKKGTVNWLMETEARHRAVMAAAEEEGEKEEMEQL